MPIYKGSFSVFPVYAGVILVSYLIVVVNNSVPRVCGGDPTTSDTAETLRAVFPVYAGVILYRARFALEFFRVPRVCGGDPKLSTEESKTQECSPCMRG